MATNNRLSSYAEGLQGKARTRYLEKLQLLNGVDLFLLADSRARSNDTAPNNQHVPPVEAADLVSYLVFCYCTAVKAHKSMEAYNQFVSGWVKDVTA